ncbi:hypothetical protein KCP75_04105 [Salmonella enterica subsp. enterica]|nr:hypothetical protein KCP75_04105 [Salmonella enterica subsp. enterica]
MSRPTAKTRSCGRSGLAKCMTRADHQSQHRTVGGSGREVISDDTVTTFRR